MERKNIFKISLVIVILIFLIVCTANSFAQTKGKGAPTGGKGKGKGKGPPPSTFYSTYPAGSEEDKILQVVEKFDNAFNTNNGELMASVWWNSKKTSRFVPRDNFLHENWQLLNERWKLRSQRPLYVSRTFRYNTKVILLDENTAIVASCFTRRSAPPDQDPQIVDNKATLVFQKDNGNWLIAHMHVSRFTE